MYKKDTAITRKKLIKCLNGLFLLVLLLILYLTFKDSAETIWAQVRSTRWEILMVLFLLTTAYLLVEGYIIFILSSRYASEFSYRQGIGCAIYSCFYRIATMGSGAGIAAIYYLNKCKVPVSKGTGMSLIQYVIHKSSMAVYSLVILIVHRGFMTETYGIYKKYLVIGFGLTAVIAVVLIIPCVAPQSYQIFLFFKRKIEKKWTNSSKKMEELEHNLLTLQEESKRLLKDRKTLVKIILANFLKFSCWYMMPYLILKDRGMLSIMDSLAVTSLVFSLAGVLPAPAGMGSVEAVFIILYSAILPEVETASTMLLFRFSTVLVPCLAGAVYALIYNRSRKGRNHQPKEDVISQEMW